MSIIHDALKKVQDGRKDLDADQLSVINLTQGNKPQKKSFQFIKFVYFLVFFVSIFSLSIFFVNRYMRSIEVKLDKVVPSQSKLPKNNFQAATPSPVKAKVMPTKNKPKLSSPHYIGNFELNGIMYDALEPLAIVNNRVVGIGEIIEGAKVKSITQTKVILTAEEQEIILALN